MKTIKNLIYGKCPYELALVAITQASDHKMNRRNVKRTLDDLKEKLNELAEMIKNEQLVFKKVNHMTRLEYGKVREITSSPFYPNQCIDYLLLRNGLDEFILKKLQYQSFGNVPGKGCHKGLKRCKKVLKKKSMNYFLKFDIHHYYPSINRDILYTKLCYFIKDKLFLKLMKQWLDNIEGPGLPIGSILSQYLALFYLSDFCRWLNKQNDVTFVCNYVDDFLVMSNRRRTLNKLIPKINKELEKYSLCLNKKTIIYRTNERWISMLGFRFILKENRKVIVKLRKRIKKSLLKRKEVWGWLKITNCYKLKEYYYKEIKYKNKEKDVENYSSVYINTKEDYKKELEKVNKLLNNKDFFNLTNEEQTKYLKTNLKDIERVLTKKSSMFIDKNDKTSKELTDRLKLILNLDIIMSLKNYYLKEDKEFTDETFNKFINGVSKKIIE